MDQQHTKDHIHDAAAIEEGRSLPLHDDIELDDLNNTYGDRPSIEYDSHYDSADDDDETTPSMPPKSRPSRSPNPPRRSSSRQHLHTERDAPSSSSAQNGNANGNANGSMNGSFRERTGKHASLDLPQDSASQTARLMQRSSFSLDDNPHEEDEKATADGHSSSTGFFDLPAQDRRNFLLLVGLYFLQGIPMGLAGGSVPFLLKHHLSYGQIGIYSLASYPYSLKLLWSPIVDAVWTPRAPFGRRKSWILPIQFLSGLGMLYLGRHATSMMESAGKDGGSGVWGFTGWWFALVFMCATQDIAVDGWALTLLSPANLSYASTAQTVGLTAGHFLSYTVFLAFSSADFANKYFRSSPLPDGLLTLNSYLTFWGYAYILATLALALLKREQPSREKDSILAVYKTMGGILKLRNIQIFILIHLIAKLGFQANDAVTNLKLLDKGFSQEDLALTVLIDFPFEIALGYYAGKWSERYTPIRVWCWAFVGRLVAAVFAQAVVMAFPKNGTTGSYLLVCPFTHQPLEKVERKGICCADKSVWQVVIVEHVFSTFMSTIMFVAISAFHAKIADPAIGGTYMTLLATCVSPPLPLLFRTY